MIRPIALSGDLTVASRVRSSWLAYSALTTVVNGAEIAVVARGAIRFRRIRTNTGTRVARACVVTLIGCRASNRIGAGANSRLTCVCLSTGVPIVTRASVCFRRIGTHSSLRIACARVVTLVARRTGDWIRSYARARLAGVRLGTGISVITRTAIRFLRI